MNSVRGVETPARGADRRITDKTLVPGTMELYTASGIKGQCNTQRSDWARLAADWQTDGRQSVNVTGLSREFAGRSCRSTWRHLIPRTDMKYAVDRTAGRERRPSTGRIVVVHQWK